MTLTDGRTQLLLELLSQLKKVPVSTTLDQYCPVSVSTTTIFYGVGRVSILITLVLKILLIQVLAKFNWSHPLKYLQITIKSELNTVADLACVYKHS